MKAILDMKKELRKGDSSKIETNPCPVCKGTGKIVAGYGVVCTEIVETVERCPNFGGEASWSQMEALKDDLALA